MIWHGRCQGSDTCQRLWQPQCFMDSPHRWHARVVGKIVFHVVRAIHPHHGCYVLKSKGLIFRRVTFLKLDFGDGFAWNISCDTRSYFSGKRNTCETCFRKVSLLRRLRASSARNAGKFAFSDSPLPPSLGIRSRMWIVSWNSGRARCAFSDLLALAQPSTSAYRTKATLWQLPTQRFARVDRTDCWPKIMSS